MRRLMSNNIRKSNFELLRILAMIIAHHITIHCFRIQLEDKNLYPLGVCFNKLFFSKESLFSTLRLISVRFLEQGVMEI